MSAFISATALVLALTACGTEEEAAGPPSPTSEQAPASGPPESQAPLSSDAPAVGGPQHPSPASDAETTPPADNECGTTSGPDGALRIVVHGGGISCDEAKELADEYSPMIATGQPQSVQGWECGPSTTPGEMALCSKDGAEIGFAP